MNLLVFNFAMDQNDTGLGFTVEWVNALAKRCQNVWVISMLAGEHEVDANVHVQSVGRERGYSELRRAARFYLMLWRLLRTQRVDVCFAHMMPLFAVMGWPLLVLWRVPIVLWYAHGHVSSLLRVATRLVDRVVSSGHTGFRIDTPKLRVLQQGIDTTRFQPRAQARAQTELTRILTVGRVSRVKRLEVVLHALADLPKAERATLIFKSVGDPLTSDDSVYVRELKQLASSLGVAECVEFSPALPFRSVPEELWQADIFVNASRTNSIDKAVLEAMSAALPVVTTNPAFTRVLGPALAETWVVAPQDPEAFRERLQRLLRMPASARRQLGLTLRGIVVREHSLAGLADRIVTELTQCQLAKAQRPPPAPPASKPSEP